MRLGTSVRSLLAPEFMMLSGLSGCVLWPSSLSYPLLPVPASFPLLILPPTRFYSAAPLDLALCQVLKMQRFRQAPWPDSSQSRVGQKYLKKRGLSNGVSTAVQKGETGSHKGGLQPLPKEPRSGTRAASCGSSRTGLSCWGCAVSTMSSSGPFQPQESLMWNAQLPPFLEKKERKKEGRKRGGPALLRISIRGTRPPFPGAVGCVCGRRGGLTVPRDGRLSVGTAPAPRSGDGWPRQTSSLGPVPAPCGQGQGEPEFPAAWLPRRVLLRMQRF